MSRMPVQIRWCIRCDLEAVVDIERGSFATPWSLEDFLEVLRQRDCIGMVAEHKHEIVGFMAYRLRKTAIELLNFAVHPNYRHRGVGTQMVQRLIDKLSQQRRKYVRAFVRETNLDAQLFFHSCGLRALNVLREHYDDTGEDAYLMQYRLPQEAYLTER
jgi:ribosomal-protein-alanine N-acetyltransferase